MVQNGIGTLERVSLATDISSYLDFVLKILFAFGFAFEIPIATFLLVLTGITDVDSLKKKRSYVIVGCFVVGMLLTPPDVISQFLLGIPVFILYEISIHIVRRFEAQRAAEEAEFDDDDYEDWDDDEIDHEAAERGP